MISCLKELSEEYHETRLLIKCLSPCLPYRVIYNFIGCFKTLGWDGKGIENSRRLWQRLNHMTTSVSPSRSLGRLTKQEGVFAGRCPEFKDVVQPA